MSAVPALDSERVLEPSATVLRKRFRASARSLMANRPLQELTQPSGQAQAVLSRSELRALDAVGLTASPWVGAAADDPLTRTIVDHMALVETSLSTAQAAALLGVDVSRVRQRIHARSLAGFDHEGEWRLPRFQFERKNVLPGLAQVLAVLPHDLSPLDLATWFLAPNIDLDVAASSRSTTAQTGPPLSPRAWLLAGGSPDTVAQLARHL